MARLEMWVCACVFVNLYLNARKFMWTALTTNTSVANFPLVSRHWLCGILKIQRTGMKETERLIPLLRIYCKVGNIVDMVRILRHENGDVHVVSSSFNTSLL